MSNAPAPAAKTKTKRFGLLAASLFAAGGLMVGCTVGVTTSNGGAPSATATQTVTVTAEAEDAKKEDKKPEAKETKTKEPKAEPTKEGPTKSQQQALRSAEDYLNYTAFSKKGLIDQLVYEKFSKEDAKWAVDQLDVDWKEQAYESALSYLDYTSFSLDGLIDQLKYEGFTQEEAEYGAKKAMED